MTKKKKCDYCGEFPANMKIDNPNVDEYMDRPEWDVCPTCARVIPLQKELTILSFMLSRHNSEKLQARLDEINNELTEISREADMPIISVEITKKDD